MSLEVGQKLAHYEILEPIGKGGMGEVYRAKDTKLGRDVAIKVLPSELAHDGERLRRFQREAKVLASLNHPNIAAIYGLEHSAGTHYLVLELVSGETLAEHLARGPIPVDEALGLAAKIAEALEEAHEHGIVHRDLKPPNIKISPKGTLKVLDFGLAKALETDTKPPASESPTMTSEGTRAGVILGTPSYMSPEQARGEAVDRRADIWAFGCVVYEMLTSRAAFTKATVSETIANVLTGEPDWTALPAGVPSSLRTWLGRCLEKNLERRLPHIGAARLELTEAGGSTATASGARWWRFFVAGVGLVAVALGVVWLVARRPAPSGTSASVSRVSIDPSPGESWVIGPHDPDIAIAPDGERIAYIAERDGETQLVVRRLDAFEATALGTFSGFIRQPFFSPDGEWIGFVNGNVLEKVAPDGGAAITICVLPSYLSGASWAPDGTIVFGTLNGGLYRVPSTGGEPEPLTSPVDVAHRWPSVLPGGRSVLFAASSGSGADIMVRSLAGGEEKRVVEGATFPLYARTGHLLYVAGGVLWGVAFDIDRLEIVGEAVPVIDGVLIKGPGESGLGAADIGVATNGTLVYRPSGATGSDAGDAGTLVWVDREGREESLNLPPRAYGRPQLSSDGTRFAVEVGDGGDEATDIWVGSADGTSLTELTFDPARDAYPVWTPDGEHVIFFSLRDGGGVFSKRADGSGSARRLLPDFATDVRVPLFVTPDGSGLVYLQASRDPLPKIEGSVRVLSLSDDGMDEPLPSFFTGNAAISPDGHWMTYISDETGDFEVYVQPYPNPSGSKWRISPASGRDPVWSRDGRELFYQRDNTMLALEVETDPSFSAGAAVELFDGPYVDALGRYYDVAPDGRFLMIKPGWLGADRTAPLRIVFNWYQELEQRVPRAE